MSIEYRLACLSPYYHHTILQSCKAHGAADSNTIQGGQVITFNTRLKAGLLFPLGHFPAERLFRPFQNQSQNRKKLAVTSVCKTHRQ